MKKMEILADDIDDQSLRKCNKSNSVIKSNNNLQSNSKVRNSTSTLLKQQQQAYRKYMFQPPNTTQMYQIRGHKVYKQQTFKVVGILCFDQIIMVNNKKARVIVSKQQQRIKYLVQVQQQRNKVSLSQQKSRNQLKCIQIQEQIEKQHEIQDQILKSHQVNNFKQVDCSQKITASDMQLISISNNEQMYQNVIAENKEHTIINNNIVQKRTNELNELNELSEQKVNKCQQEQIIKGVEQQWTSKKQINNVLQLVIEEQDNRIDRNRVENLSLIRNQSVNIFKELLDIKPNQIRQELIVSQIDADKQQSIQKQKQIQIQKQKISIQLSTKQSVKLETSISKILNPSSITLQQIFHSPVKNSSKQSSTPNKISRCSNPVSQLLSKSICKQEAQVDNEYVDKIIIKANLLNSFIQNSNQANLKHQPELQCHNETFKDNNKQIENNNSKIQQLIFDNLHVNVYKKIQLDEAILNKPNVLLNKKQQLKDKEQKLLIKKNQNIMKNFGQGIKKEYRQKTQIKSNQSLQIKNIEEQDKNSTSIKKQIKQQQPQIKPTRQSRRVTNQLMKDKVQQIINKLKTQDNLTNNKIEDIKFKIFIPKKQQIDINENNENDNIDYDDLIQKSQSSYQKQQIAKKKHNIKNRTNTKAKKNLKNLKKKQKKIQKINIKKKQQKKNVQIDNNSYNQMAVLQNTNGVIENGENGQSKKKNNGQIVINIEEDMDESVIKSQNILNNENKHINRADIDTQNRQGQGLQNGLKQSDQKLKIKQSKQKSKKSKQRKQQNKQNDQKQKIDHQKQYSNLIKLNQTFIEKKHQLNTHIQQQIQHINIKQEQNQSNLCFDSLFLNQQSRRTSNLSTSLLNKKNNNMLVNKIKQQTSYNISNQKQTKYTKVQNYNKEKQNSVKLNKSIEQNKNLQIDNYQKQNTNTFKNFTSDQMHNEGQFYLSCQKQSFKQQLQQKQQQNNQLQNIQNIQQQLQKVPQSQQQSLVIPLKRKDQIKNLSTNMNIKTTKKPTLMKQNPNKTKQKQMKSKKQALNQKKKEKKKEKMKEKNNQKQKQKQKNKYLTNKNDKKISLQNKQQNYDIFNCLKKKSTPKDAKQRHSQREEVSKQQKQKKQLQKKFQDIQLSKQRQRQVGRYVQRQAQNANYQPLLNNHNYIQVDSPIIQQSKCSQFNEKLNIPTQNIDANNYDDNVEISDIIDEQQQHKQQEQYKEQKDKNNQQLLNDDEQKRHNLQVKQFIEIESSSLNQNISHTHTQNQQNQSNQKDQAKKSNEQEKAQKQKNYNLRKKQLHNFNENSSQFYCQEIGIKNSQSCISQKGSETSSKVNRTKYYPVVHQCSNQKCEDKQKYVYSCGHKPFLQWKDIQRHFRKKLKITITQQMIKKQNKQLKQTQISVTKHGYDIKRYLIPLAERKQMKQGVSIQHGKVFRQNKLDGFFKKKQKIIENLQQK